MFDLMNISTIKDVGAMVAGTSIDALHVTIKSAFDPIPSKGPSSKYYDQVQNVTAEDDTGTIKIAFFDAAVNLKQYEGQAIQIIAEKEKQIKAIDYNNKKTGVTERQITVNKGATIDEIVGNPAPQSDAPRNAGAHDRKTASEVAGKVHYVEDAETKRQSIERQAALEQAVQWSLGSSTTPNDIVVVAEKFYDFLSGKGPTTITMPVPTPENAPSAILPPDGDDQVL